MTILLHVFSLQLAMSDSAVLCRVMQQLLERGGCGLTSAVRLRSLTRLLYSNSTEWVCVWEGGTEWVCVCGRGAQSKCVALFKCNKNLHSLPLYSLLSPTLSPFLPHYPHSIPHYPPLSLPLFPTIPHFLSFSSPLSPTLFLMYMYYLLIGMVRPINSFPMQFKNVVISATEHHPSGGEFPTTLVTNGNNPTP